MIISPHNRFNLPGLPAILVRAVFVGLIGFVFGYSQPAYAQVCLDFAREPAFSQSFGRVGAGVSLAGRTNYPYSAEACPLDGSYTVADAVDGNCFLTLWHDVPEDHTPNDARGNMMIVNGSNRPVELYTLPPISLCSGTTYELSVWAINLLEPRICSAPLLPELAISVETASGQVLQSISISPIPQAVTPSWQRYATLFTAPETTEAIVVKLINLQSTEGCGNDMALDDIQLKQCGACSPAPMYVPGAFSPNNDGVNDQLAVFLREATAYSITVFNRWGSPVFTSDALNQPWDGTYSGTPCPTGDYTWVINYQLTDATNVARKYVKTGRVLLLR